jgi:3-oxoacyl-[acyl-carrier-protein] synthase II
LPSVAILGAGVVSPAGNDLESFWRGVCQGRSFAENLDIHVNGLPLIGHRVRGDDWLAPFTHSELRRIDRFTLLGLSAMAQAVQQASSSIDRVEPCRRALVAGVGFGGIATLTSQHLVLESQGWRKLSPFGVASVMASSLVAYGSIRFDIQGEASTVTSACASGTQALVHGVQLIRSGAADIVIAGGAEAPLAALPMASFARMEATASGTDDPEVASRPFDAARRGFVLGEGAGFIVLASDDVAKGASPALGTIDGWSVTTDSYHIIAPHPTGDGATRCMRSALAQAELHPADIVHVNAHGTGTIRNDHAEGAALAEVFGPYGVPVTSIKGAIGHLMGGAGAVEAVEALLSAGDGLVPPTVNCDELDEQIEVDVVRSTPRTIPKGPSLSCSFAFGGQNAAVVISPP